MIKDIYNMESETSIIHVRNRLQSTLCTDVASLLIGFVDERKGKLVNNFETERTRAPVTVDNSYITWRDSEKRDGKTWP
ncbi:hypothetical protein EVAR_56611_1 [Eumeta japonica]|uniref:Uncharacterized protein n=1 Tax=Eumeta variegata TaxID=151549 RepID=A0A4C1Z2D8_EUMVA|nr:hypothetical protein EVAR_56611_1 [Eumeta japonica]